MKSLEQLNQQYGTLCARLGENTYRMRQLKEIEIKLLQAIEQLEAESRALRSANPEEPTDE